MKMRNSPLARTPPANLPVIPGVTAPKDANRKIARERTQRKRNDSPSLYCYRVYQRGRG